MDAIPIAAPQPAVVRAVYARGPLELEARLVAQVRAPAALRRALARVVGRMVETSGWERLGCARPGDYAVERAGISAREFRDLAAVDGALRELPVLDAAFCGGEIGWTQLRLLCRVATAEDQQEWLGIGETSWILRRSEKEHSVKCPGTGISKLSRSRIHTPVASVSMRERSTLGWKAKSKLDSV